MVWCCSMLIPGKDTNRTVVTLVGTPEGVEEAAFRAIKKASEIIDMQQHSGAHPRMGATDVCPFVPVAGVTTEDCIEISKKLGKRVGDELKIPVFLYEHSASTKERQNLANIRQGEFERNGLRNLKILTGNPISVLLKYTKMLGCSGNRCS